MTDFDALAKQIGSESNPAETQGNKPVDTSEDNGFSFSDFDNNSEKSESDKFDILAKEIGAESNRSTSQEFPQEIANPRQFGSEYQEKRSVADAAMAGSIYSNPDKVIKAIKLGKQYGLPPSAVEPSIDEFEQKSELQATREVLKNNNILTNWVADNPQKAAAVRDDMENLAWFEQNFGKKNTQEVFGDFREKDKIQNLPYFEKQAGAYQEAIDIDKMNVDYQEIGQDLILGKELTPEQQQRLKEMNSFRQKDYFPVVNAESWGERALNFASGVPSMMRQTIPQWYRALTSPEAVTLGGAGLLAPVPFGAGAGYSAGVTVNMARQEGAIFRAQLEDIKDDNGVPLDPMVKNGAAIGYGMASGALEKLGFKYVAKLFPGADKIFGKITKEGFVKLAKSESGKVALQKLGQIATAIIAEGGTEALQQAAQIAFTEMSKALSSKDITVAGVTAEQRKAQEQGEVKNTFEWMDKALKGEEVTPVTQADINLNIVNFLTDSLEQTAQAFVGGAQAGGGIAVGGHATTAAYEKLKPIVKSGADKLKPAFKTAAEAITKNKAYQASQQKLSDAIEKTKESKTFKRSPEVFEEVSKKTMADNKIWIPADKLYEYFQKNEMKGFDEFSSVVPEVKEQMDKALEEGSNLELPAEKVLSAFGQIQGIEELQKSMAFSPDALPDEDINDTYTYQVVPELEELEVEDAKQKMTEADKIERHFLDQFRNAGRTEALAKDYATVARKYYETRASRVKSPEERAIILEGMKKVAVEQAEAPETFDDFIDKARRYKEPAKPKFPISDYLKSKGGIKSGSLLAKELEARNIGKKEARGLFKMFGKVQGVDNISAQEFKERFGLQTVPEDGNGYVDPDFILKALEDEIAGQPIDVLPEEGADIKEFKNYLDEMGIDLKTATNEDIKKALNIEDELYQDGKLNTDSEAFKKWFGDSKVVDKNGKPLVVYHGTASIDIEQFLPKGGAEGSAEFLALFQNNVKNKEPFGYLNFRSGSFFSPNPDYAGNYTAENTGVMYPVYIKAENPVYVSMDKKGPPPKGVDPTKTPDALILTSGQNHETINEIAVIDPTQIKSVFNRGTFDPNDPRILYQSATNETQKETTDKAIEIAGTTTNPLEAGFITYDGKMLSNVKDGKRIDHEDIAREVVGDGKDSLFNFMEQSNAVRVDFKNGFISARVMPNERQLQQIVKAAREAGLEQLQIDYVPADGKSMASRPVGKITVGNIRQVLESGEINLDTLYQGKKIYRGSTTFLSDRTIMKLFKGADVSTPMHEMAHIFLRIEKALTGLSPELDNDHKALLKWMGIDSFDKMKVEHEEKFARGFEQYLREGKAPSLELRDLFRRFKGFMISLYKKALSLNVELNDDVRAVFDRMLATDEEIEDAKNYALFKPNDLVMELMSPEQRATYLRINNRKVEIAKEKLLKKALAQYEKKNTEQYKKDYAAVKEEMTRMVNQQPVNQLVYFLRTGKFLDKETPEGTIPFKINRALAKAMLGKKVEELPTGLLSEDGLQSAAVAEMFGFKDANTMMSALLNTTSRDEQIKNATENEMIARYGDMLNDGTIEREALEALHNQSRATQIYYELKRIDDAAGFRRASKESYKARAKDIIGETKLDGLRPDKYYQAEVRAARETGKALAKKDFEKAADWKSKQLLNHYLFLEAKEARKYQSKAEKLFKKVLGSDKKIGANRTIEMVNAARAILTKFGFGNKSYDIAKIFADIQKYNPNLYDSLEETIYVATAEAKPYKELTLDNLKELTNAVESLWEKARDDKIIETEGKVEDLAKVQQELADTLDLKERNFGAKGTVTEGNKFTRALLDFQARARIVEQWVSEIDRTGLIRKYVFTPVREAIDNYLAKKREIYDKFLKILEPIKDTLIEGEIYSPELDYTFGRTDNKLIRAGLTAVGNLNSKSAKSEILAALLNTGNKSNFQKLLRGRGWGEFNEDGTLNTERWDAFVERMIAEGVITKTDYDFVQGVWDLLEEIKPLAWKAFRDKFGYLPDEIVALPFKTPFGEYKGGYYPAEADPLIPKKNQRQDDLNTLQSGVTTFPVTNRSFTKKRSEAVAEALALDLKFIPAHIDKVLRFAYIQKPVDQVFKLLNRGTFADKLNASDPALIKEMLIPWLERSVKQKTMSTLGNPAYDQFFSALRNRAGMVGLVGNISNTIQQILGLSIARLKIKNGANLRNALVDYMKNPREFSDAIRGLSVFMSNRTDTQMMEVYNDIEDIITRPSKYKDSKTFFEKIKYLPQQMTQNIVDCVAWSAAFNEATAEGQTQQEAIRHADSVVRETQGSFNAADISVFNTGNGIMRLFNMFQNYFNMIANISLTEARKAVKEMGFRGSSMRLLQIYMYGFMIPAFFSEAIFRAFSGELWKDKDHDGYLNDLLEMFFASQAKYAVAMVPVIGPTAYAGLQVSGLLENKFNSGNLVSSPVVTSTQAALAAPKAVYKAATGEGSWKTAAKDTLTLLTMLTGHPAFAFATRPASYLADVAEGKEKPKNIIDFTRGVISGKSNKDIK